MQIRRIKVQGFRSLFVESPPRQADQQIAASFASEPGLLFAFDPLTVLIGPNDCGKSSVLDLLELVLSDSRPDPDDFHRPFRDPDGPGGETSASAVESMTAVVEFFLNPTRDAAVVALAQNGILTLRVIFTHESTVRHLLAQVPGDPRLRQDFTRLLASEQIALINELDASALDTLRNVQQRAEWLREFALGVPTNVEWAECPRGLPAMLPRFERYSTMDYDDPAGLVLKTLRQVYESVIFVDKTVDGVASRQHIRPLEKIRREVERRINQEIQQLLDYIKRYNQRVLTISFDPTIDFSGGLRAGQFQIDDGHGLRYLSKVGDGTKRRMFIAVVDWDRDVALAEAASEGESPSIIRGYDEPDTNLDFVAQRRMYQAISDIVSPPNSRIQAVVCTHSPRLVDQAPAHSIRLLSWEGGRTSVSWLRTDDDHGIELFLSSLARELGLTNTLMFYERCFILVEGSTEENALPTIYRTIYGHSLLEDGIRLINVESNGAVKEFLKLMSKNRQELTLVLADLDAEQAGKGPKLTSQILAECQFSDEFVRNHVHLIPTAAIRGNGTEFEASFSDATISRTLQTEWPRKDGEWTQGDIAPLREPAASKFSDQLKSAVWNMSQEDARHWAKPVFGSILGRVATKDEIPEEILRLFNHARQLADCA